MQSSNLIQSATIGIAVQQMALPCMFVTSILCYLMQCSIFLRDTNENSIACFIKLANRNNLM